MEPSKILNGKKSNLIRFNQRPHRTMPSSSEPAGLNKESIISTLGLWVLTLALYREIDGH